VVGLSHGRVVFDVPTDHFDGAAFEQLYGPPGTGTTPASAA
jgi:ABC-type phosphate/phosphonate transport system ATPase subunit